MLSNYPLRRLVVATLVPLALTFTVFTHIAWAAQSLDDFMRSAKPGQEAVVEGVVSGVWQKQGRLGLIDTEEYIQCKSVNCGKMTLPVLWVGEMPQVASTVHVTGKVTKKVRLMFAAESLKVVALPPKPDFKGGAFK